MQKQLLSFFSFIAIVFLFITGCGKDNAPAAPKKTQLITQGSWKFQKATAGGREISSSVNACFKDNIATFTSSGNMTLDEGTTICSPSYAGSYTWSFQTSESVLHLSAAIFTGGSRDFFFFFFFWVKIFFEEIIRVVSFPPPTAQVKFKNLKKDFSNIGR